MIEAVLSGFALSFFQVEGLRRSSLKILRGKQTRWALAFGLRWTVLALLFWIGLHVFKQSLWAFTASFVFSGFLIRLWRGRSFYAR